MAPSITSSTASPLSRILLSLPKPSNAQASRCAKAAPGTDSGAGAKKSSLVFSRREAAATALSTVLSRVLPAVAAETDVVSAGECALATTPSGLAFCDRVVGAGAEAVKGQLIKAHYRGMLEDGTVFDSSYGRGRPLTIMVGVGEVIKGWDMCIAGGEGIPPMRIGGKRSLRLPPELAYGEKGAGCRGWEPTSCAIPPNSTLLFDVEYVGRASS